MKRPKTLFKTIVCYKDGTEVIFLARYVFLNRAHSVVMNKVLTSGKDWSNVTTTIVEEK